MFVTKNITTLILHKEICNIKINKCLKEISIWIREMKKENLPSPVSVGISQTVEGLDQTQGQKRSPELVFRLCSTSELLMSAIRIKLNYATCIPESPDPKWQIGRMPRPPWSRESVPLVNLIRSCTQWVLSLCFSWLQILGAIKSMFIIAWFLISPLLVMHCLVLSACTDPKMIYDSYLFFKIQYTHLLPQEISSLICPPWFQDNHSNLGVLRRKGKMIKRWEKGGGRRGERDVKRIKMYYGPNPRFSAMVLTCLL